MNELQTKVKFAAKLFAKGYSRHKVSEELQKTYNVSQITASRYISGAYELLKGKQDNFIHNLRHIQLTRLENLLDKAMEKNDIKTALEVIKTTNNMFGLNQPEVQVNIQNNECVFKFGDPITDESI